MPHPQKVENLEAVNYMHEYLPFLPVVPYSTGFGFPNVHKPHPSQMTNQKNGELLEGSAFAPFAAISYYVATCHLAVCVPWAFAERYWC